MTKNSITVGNYQYDGRGLRTVKTVSGKTTLFIYCKSGKLLAEADSDGNVLKEYKPTPKPSNMESLMNDAKKRDFVTQIISLVEAEQNALTDKGFNPTERLDGLKVKKQAADSAETEQQEAAARAQEATTHAHETLADAYKDASDFADVISGLLGKDNELVKKMRKFRK